MLRSGARPHPEAGASTSEETAHAQQLYEYLQLEHKFQPKLCLPSESENGEVTTGARDGAAHVLRCLKVWFDLPADVFIHAINLFDRFLTKMKVRPCHVPCITVSCMNIALDQYARDIQQPRKVSVEELVSISQSACTAGDVGRMSRIIADKVSAGEQAPLTHAHWLRLLLALVAARDKHALAPQESELLNLLEIVVCDSSCVNARTSELALVLLYHKLEENILEYTGAHKEGGPTRELPEDAYALFDIAAQIQTYCQMSDASLCAVRGGLRGVLAAYSARAAAPQRQRLVWRLSERTLKVLRPTDRIRSLLPTIQEQHFAVDVTPPRPRSGSESSENEETSDWPRSPVLPVYCDN